MKFSVDDFFSKCEEILNGDLHLLKKSSMENFISCALSIRFDCKNFHLVEENVRNNFERRIQITVHKMVLFAKIVNGFQLLFIIA